MIKVFVKFHDIEDYLVDIVDISNAKYFDTYDYREQY